MLQIILKNSMSFTVAYMAFCSFGGYIRQKVSFTLSSGNTPSKRIYVRAQFKAAQVLSSKSSFCRRPIGLISSSLRPAARPNRMCASVQSLQSLVLATVSMIISRKPGEIVFPK
jgi:hypothetical protein